MQTQSLNQKILFTIIPQTYWLLLIGGIFLSFMSGKLEELSNLAFNLLFFLIGVKLAVLIHEIGHLVLAKLVGGIPRRMVLGKGHKVIQTEAYGVKVVLNSNFNSGLAYSVFPNLENLRIKLILYTIGGILFNFAIVGILWLFIDYSREFTNSIHILSSIGYANLLLGIFALFPYQIEYNGIHLNSDGLSLLKIPFYKKEQLIEISSVNELLDAYDLIEAKKYEEAIKVYEQFQTKVENSKGININLGVAYMKLGNFEKALALYEELIPLVDEDQFQAFKGYIYNGYAWLNLLFSRMEEADKYSALAYELDPKSEHFRGTRASVLIELGEIEAGKKLVIKDVDFNFPNSQTLAAAFYLGLVFNELNEVKKSKKYMDFVEMNLHHLEADELFLYERIKKKMEAV